MENKGIKKELQVAALCNGTAIDHIPSEVLFKVVRLLKLDSFDNRITIGNNFESKKMRSKGIIKISNYFFHENDINKLAVIAPHIILNTIKDYEVVEKKRIELPDELFEIVKCTNPKCITNNELMKTRFQVINKESIELRCHYCDTKIMKEEIILK